MALEITEDNFDQLVLQASADLPVLLDFWAEWCGPCRMLGPVLDKVEKEYDGRFRLAKLNTDHSPGIAARYKISGIPAVKLFSGGQVIGEFVGAYPEPQVRQFLDKHLPDPNLLQLKELAADSPVAAALAVVEQDLRGQEYEAVLWRGVVASVANGVEGVAPAREFLSRIPGIGGTISEARNAMEGFLERGSDAARMQKVAELLTKGSPAIMDESLQRIENGNSVDRESARADLIACFHLLGNQGDLVNSYRRKLSSALF